MPLNSKDKIKCPGQDYWISLDVCKHRVSTGNNPKCEKCPRRKRVEEEPIRNKIEEFLDKIRKRNSESVCDKQLITKPEPKIVLEKKPEKRMVNRSVNRSKKSRKPRKK